MNLWYKKFQKVSKKEKKAPVKEVRNIMNIGNQILSICKEHQLTQAEFGKLFHIT